MTFSKRPTIVLVLMMLPLIAPAEKRTAQKTRLKGYFSTFSAIFCRCMNQRQLIVKKRPD
jgi:hypothetical protein